MSFKDTAFERLAILKNLAETLAENQISQELYTLAKSSAHKLAGSLGGFGFPEGSKIAKQIEKFLEDSLNQGERRQFTELIAALEAELQQQPFEAAVSKALGKNVAFLIVDRDGDYSQQLVSESRNNSVETHTAINGIELCQILRSDRRWRQLSVLFLTGHHDKKTEYQAFAIGADDYISKPVIASELANRILNRLRRSKLNS